MLLYYCYYICYNVCYRHYDCYYICYNVYYRHYDCYYYYPRRRCAAVRPLRASDRPPPTAKTFACPLFSDHTNNGTNMSTLAGNLSDYYDTYYQYIDQCGMETIPSFTEYKAAEALTTFLYPLFLLLGTLGNAAALVLLRHLSIQAWSSCFYLAVLAVVDLVVLYIRCGGAWLLKVGGVNPYHRVMSSSDAMCKTFLFVLNMLLQMWPWLMVALGVELLISTRYPLKTYRLCTRERARATVLLITILLVCLNLNFFWTWGLLETQGGKMCAYIEEFSMEFMDYIWPIIDTGVKHVLPLLAVTACFLVSALSLLRSGRQGAAAYEPILKKYFLDLRALQQLKHTSLVLVLLFLVIKTLTFAVVLVNALDAKGIFVVPCERYAQFRASVYLLKAVGDASVYAFLSLKFLVYFAFCASFRRRFFVLVRKMLFCCRKGGAEGEGRRAVKGGADGRHVEERGQNCSSHAASAQPNCTRLGDSSCPRPAAANQTTHV